MNTTCFYNNTNKHENQTMQSQDVLEPSNILNSNYSVVKTNIFNQLPKRVHQLKWLITLLIFLFIATGNAIAGDWEKTPSFLYRYTGTDTDVRTPIKDMHEDEDRKSVV